MRDIVALGVKRWGSCSADMSKASFRTFMLGGGAEEPVYSAQQRGRLTFLAVCNGCHAYNTVLHGPTLQAIKALYADDPAAMLAFVKSPVHKRSDFPEMPPQAYLGDDTLRAVTNYILHEASN
jgi:cytochrome c551/c552